MASYEKTHIVHSCLWLMYHKLYIPDKLVKRIQVEDFYTANQLFFQALIDTIEKKTEHKIEHVDIKQGIVMFLQRLNTITTPDNREPYDGYKNYSGIK